MNFARFPGPLPALLRGLWICPRALGFMLRKPRLIAHAALPIALTALLVIGLVFGVSWLVTGWLAQLIGVTEAGWRQWLYYPLAVVIFLGSVVLGVTTLSLFGTLLAAPFLDGLSERAERYWRAASCGARAGNREDRAAFGPDEEGDSAEGSAAGQGTLSGTVRGVSDAVRLAGLKGGAQVVLLPLLLVPVLGAAVNLAVLSYFIGAEFLDVALSRHGFTYREKKGVIRANRFTVLGFGAGVTLCLLIPLTTLLVLPIGVVGGTLLYLELSGEGRLRT